MFSSKVLALLALIAAVCFLALIGLQIGELMYYGAEPSVWPVAK